MNNPDFLDDVFDRFSSAACVFRDREVLRHDYIPERLPHREEQIRRFGETIAPVLKGVRCSNVFLYGKTGTGKTAVIKYVLNRLEMRAQEFGAPVKTCYVNCRLEGTKYRVLARLCEELGLSVPFTGLSVGEVFNRFRIASDSLEMILFAVLDEIDVLVKERDQGLLYELTRINGSLSNSKVILAGISNDLRFKEFLDPRVFSSLSEEEIVFRPYDANELKIILADRAKLAFRDEVLCDGALSLCAALAAAEHGDARRALDLLRVAGEVAERNEARTVTGEHVREAEKYIEHDRVSEALKNLTLHSKLVILSIFHLTVKNKGAVTGEIYEMYENLCDQLAITPLTQRRVSTLLNELDAVGLLNARVVSMGRYGRTKKIGMEVTRTIIRTVFSEDCRVGQLVEHRPRLISK
ncbi:MAG: orc1/cdc6 family replication initiation protein [Candidatus Bathyarchaeota archaeon]|jgi:cell division control protein 6